MIGAVAFQQPQLRNREDGNRTKEDAMDAMESQLPKWLDIVLGNATFVAIFLYFIWTMIGVIFYKYYNGWTFATAFFFAMEAGLSVGFCNPVEKDNNSRAFTIVYVLVGSSIISGAIGFWMSDMFNPSVRILPAKESELPPFATTNFFTYARMWVQVNICHYTVTRSSIFVFIICMALGTAYGVIFEGWTVISSLYFAVTTASTGGLQSPICEKGSGETCDIGLVRGSLMAVFMLVSIPGLCMRVLV